MQVAKVATSVHRCPTVVMLVPDFSYLCSSTLVFPNQSITILVTRSAFGQIQLKCLNKLFM